MTEAEGHQPQSPAVRHWWSSARNQPTGPGSRGGHWHDPEFRRQYFRDWRAAHPEYRALQSERRRQREREARLIRDRDEVDRRGPYLLLSKQERRVVRYRALGLTRWEIAGRMKISDRTVMTYVRNLKAKLVADSMVDVFRMIGWLRVPERA